MGVPQQTVYAASKVGTEALARYECDEENSSMIRTDLFAESGRPNLAKAGA